MDHLRAAAFALLLLALVGQVSQAQQNDPLASGIVELQTDIKGLRAEQQQIINELRELRQILAANAVAGPSPQPLRTAISIDGAPARGDSTARVAIIEFADYECPYCGRFDADVYPQIAENYIATGKVRHYFRDLPLPMHSHAMPAARAARCAAEQDKYWEMHDSLFANQRSLLNQSLLDRAAKLGLDTAKFDECLSSTRYLDDIRNSMAEAQKLGVTGTPTFFLGTISTDEEVVNITKVIRGALPYEAFKAALDELLAKAEQQ